MTPTAHHTPHSAPTDTMPSGQNPSFGRFFLPGPTEVHPEVLAAQLRPMIGHRGKAMVELMAGLQPGLKRLFRTNRPVYVSGSSATGLMEAAIRNCALTRVLALVNGAFSDRFRAIAVSNGLEVDALEVEWGQVHDPQQVADTLAAGNYDAVTVVHSETSTGALNPIHDLATVVHEAGDVVLLVDSVTGLAGAPVESDAWGLDFVLTGSQKALALPPGLALGVAQPSALARAHQKSNRGTYFDFLDFEKNLEKNQTPNTPPLSLLYALQEQLARIEVEGVEGRWARHHAMAERTWAWVDEIRDRGIALEVLAPPGARSPTVTNITLPPTIAGPDVVGAMADRGFTIGGGYGKLKPVAIRIGHMGDHTVTELDILLQNLEEVLLT